MNFVSQSLAIFPVDGKRLQDPGDSLLESRVPRWVSHHNLQLDLDGFANEAEELVLHDRNVANPGFMSLPGFALMLRRLLLGSRPGCAPCHCCTEEASEKTGKGAMA